MKDECCRPIDLSKGAGPFFGRLFISLIFILSGLMKIVYFNQTVSAVQGVGVQGAAFFTILALLFELAGGLLVLLGWYTRIGVYILMIFLLPTTLLFHGFWNFQGPEQSEQMAHFLKNLTLYGGLLLLWSYGPGRWSLDAKRCRSKA